MKTSSVNVRPWSKGVVVVELLNPMGEKALCLVKSDAVGDDLDVDLAERDRIDALHRARGLARDLLKLDWTG